MNDYRQRLGLNGQFEPSTTTSMGRFFSNRLRDSLHIGGALTTNERENFDQTTADHEATPEPPISVYDVNRSIVTPSSTCSTNDSYFTHTTPDIHKFSRRVELSSGYNILKNRSSSRPTRLPGYLQGRAPLAQLNPLPTTVTTNNPEDIRRRRLSFTDHNRTQNLAYTQHILQQFNADGTRRPFSSDSPLPPPPPTLPVAPPALTTYYALSAPPIHNRTVYEPMEPLKLVSEQEDNSIAALSRELRAAAYPTTRKSSNHSPSRETSPSTTRYTTRISSKRVPPPRSLPKLHTNEQQTSISNVKMTHFYHHHESEKLPPPTDERSQNSTLLIDQFFDSEPLPIKETIAQTHETVSINAEKTDREHNPAPTILMRTSSLPTGTDDTTMSFVTKYARLAPIVSSPAVPASGNASLDENNNHINRSFTLEINYHEQILDEHLIITDDLLQTSEMGPSDETFDENYSYVPLKEELKSLHAIPLLELDELETNSDISESQLVPIIYAKELANEIELLQKAHLLKQQQRSIAMSNENDRTFDNNSIPPPENMELLNFEALEEEFSVMHRQEITPIPSPKMEISSPPITARKPLSSPSLRIECETPITSILQHGILAHNRLSPWFKLPTELWFKILPFLNTVELHHFSYVCKRFYLLAQDKACRHRIVMNHRLNFDQLWFDSISRRKPMSLTFSECRQQNLENTQQENNSNNIKWNEFFQSIGSTLVEFTMSGCYHEPFTPNTLLPIIVQTCSSLLSLKLRWNNIAECTLNHLVTYSQLIHLRTLDLTGCQVLDDTLLINIFIRSERDFDLEKLVLHACTNITWVSLDTIAVCLPNLSHLNISRCIGLKSLPSDQTPTCFSYWPQLQYIDFGHLLTLTDNDLTIVFDHCKYLHTFIFDDCIHLTDQTLSRLTSTFQMISLNNCTNFSTNAFWNLNEQCPSLHTISLQSISTMNDTCLVKWSEKPFLQLKNLVLDYCTACTLNGLEHFLRTHSNLQTLSLNGNLIATVIEQQRLEQTYSNIKFVFQ